jgi:hypothetical protein
MSRKEHLTNEGLNKIVSIRASLNLGLSEGLVKGFPNVSPADRSLVEDQEIQNPN